MVALELAVEKAKICAGRILVMKVSGFSPDISFRISISVTNRCSSSAPVSVTT